MQLAPSTTNSFLFLAFFFPLLFFTRHKNHCRFSFTFTRSPGNYCHFPYILHIKKSKKVNRQREPLVLNSLQTQKPMRAREKPVFTDKGWLEVTTLSKPRNTEQDHLTTHNTHQEHLGRDGGRVGLELSLSGFFGVKSSSYSVI